MEFCDFPACPGVLGISRISGSVESAGSAGSAGSIPTVLVGDAVQTASVHNGLVLAVPVRFAAFLIK